MVDGTRRNNFENAVKKKYSTWNKQQKKTRMRAESWCDYEVQVDLRTIGLEN